MDAKKLIAAMEAERNERRQALELMLNKLQPYLEDEHFGYRVDSADLFRKDGQHGRMQYEKVEVDDGRRPRLLLRKVDAALELGYELDKVYLRDKHGGLLSVKFEEN